MQYELTFLLNDEEEVKNIKSLVESLKGALTKEEKWGKKTLCYPIKKVTNVNFYNFVFDMEKKNLQELRKKLTFNEKLTRFLLLQNENKKTILVNNK